MKILMLIKKLHYSGAPKMFLWLAKSLADRGFDVTILTYKKNLYDVVPSNVKWVALDLENSGFLKIQYTIRKYLKTIKPDCCISFLLDSNIFNILACIGLKTKSIICERNDPFRPKYYKLKIVHPLFRFAKGGVFQLPRVAEYYSNIKAPIAIIPNPVVDNHVSVDQYGKRPDIITTVGRIDLKQKRLDVLVKAFSIFHKQKPEYKLFIYGDNRNLKDIAELKSLIDLFKLDGKIVLKGYTATPQDVMKNSKFFVMTSDFEGIPNSLIEAMSIGLPCIATDCRPGGAAFLIKNEKNGLLASCGNVEDIAEKMLFMANNPAEANRMGREAQKIVETYSEKKIATLWEDYLKDLCNVSN